VKHIAILGSTGSIGENALKVARRFPDKFRLVALSTDSNIDILHKQIKEFKPRYICVRNLDAARKLKKITNSRLKFFEGEDGLEELVKNKDIDNVLLAISGASALSPLLKAVESGKQISLANKEALVMAGPIIMNLAAKKRVKIIPIDSEQSAIWQCLEGEDSSKLKNIYLTASGGPFRQASIKDLRNISVKRVLKHPRWKMGRKISVDSANLMNKGLELLETIFLFNCSYKKVKIVIHPQALVHSMVEFIDGVILAQISATDMRIPIQYALSYPGRLSSPSPSVDFCKVKSLEFFAPDFDKFPCLGLAYRVAAQLGTMPAVLNAANEICVREFLNRKLQFLSIPKIIENVIQRHRNKIRPELQDVLEADSWAREESSRLICRLN
jgi:1-deoxy-D-xylulose-5-phosphate reductoisomerase